MTDAQRAAPEPPQLSSAFTDALPADPVRGPGIRQVGESAYSFVSPTAVSAPRTLAVAAPVAAHLRLDADWVASPAFADATRQRCPGATVIFEAGGADRSAVDLVGGAADQRLIGEPDPRR